jgi:hypothetical protein
VRAKNDLAQSSSTRAGTVGSNTKAGFPADDVAKPFPDNEMKAENGDGWPNTYKHI